MSASTTSTASRDARFAPKAPSLPLLGRALGYRRGNVGALEKIRDDHGDLVWIHIFGGLRVLAFLSADGLEVGLRNKDGAYSNRLGWERFLDSNVFPGPSSRWTATSTATTAASSRRPSRGRTSTATSRR